ncbi:low molecular weight phosphatase family protein [Streptomyces albidoflavus]
MSVSPPPAWPDERLSAGAARRASRHQAHFSVETVQQLLTDPYRLLAENARLRTHLVVLAERLTAERLAALAHTRTPGPGAAVRVLFVCGHNAGRSQMAAALLAHRAGERVVVPSAGTDPAAEIEPHVAPGAPGSGPGRHGRTPSP